jgi:hypothetical protein
MLINKEECEKEKIESRVVCKYKKDIRQQKQGQKTGGGGELISELQQETKVSETQIKNTIVTCINNKRKIRQRKHRN